MSGLLIGGFEGSGVWHIGEYRILIYDHNIKQYLPGHTPDDPFKSNTVLDSGRKQVAKKLLNITTPSSIVNFTHMAVGDDTTPADPTDTALLNELTGNANRIALTNSTGGSFADTDIVADTSVAGFRWKTIAQALFDEADGNNGDTFAEWGLASQAAFGGGVFYNRFVSSSPFTKTASLSVTAQMILRT